MVVVFVVGVVLGVVVLIRSDGGASGGFCTVVGVGVSSTRCSLGES